MTEMEKLFEKMLNMELTNEEMFEQCRNVAHEPMTNEEWLRNLSFNELARVLYCMIINGERIRPDLAYIKRWLKQPHKPIS